MHKYAQICTKYAKIYAEICKNKDIFSKNMQKHARNMQEYAGICLGVIFCIVRIFMHPHSADARPKLPAHGSEAATVVILYSIPHQQSAL